MRHLTWGMGTERKVWPTIFKWQDLYIFTCVITFPAKAYDLLWDLFLGLSVLKAIQGSCSRGFDMGFTSLVCCLWTFTAPKVWLSPPIGAKVLPLLLSDGVFDSGDHSSLAMFCNTWHLMLPCIEGIK